MVFTIVLDGVRKFKFYSCICSDSSVLVHNVASATEVKLSSLSVVFYTRLYGITLFYTVLLFEKKQVKKPVPFLIQQVLAPIAAEGPVEVSGTKPPNVTTVMELVNHKARTMLLCPLYSPAHLDIRSGNRGFSP